MNKKINILILGDGQLSAMLKESIKTLKIRVECISIDQLKKYFYTKKLQDILSNFDFVTYETENISIEIIKFIHQYSIINPNYKILQISQDRLREKQLFNNLKINTNKFLSISTKKDLIFASQKLNFPFLVKTRNFGYDGKGQYKIRSVSDLNSLYNNINKKNIQLIGEQLVNFDYEISQIACRDRYDNIVYYPNVINKHYNGILRETYIVKINIKLIQQAQKYITQIMLKFDYVGILTIEFFVKNNILYANETAPRVHNSGHWSINGSNVSQFKNHMLAISNNKIIQHQLTKKYLIMINLIGEKFPNITLPNNVNLKDYGKDIRKNRKMGHINIFDNNLQNFIKSYNYIYNNIIAKKPSSIKILNSLF